MGEHVRLALGVVVPGDAVALTTCVLFSGEIARGGLVFVLGWEASPYWIDMVDWGDSGLGLVLETESDAEFVSGRRALNPRFTLVLGMETNGVVLPGVEVLIGRLHGGVATIHWG